MVKGRRVDRGARQNSQSAKVVQLFFALPAVAPDSPLDRKIAANDKYPLVARGLSLLPMSPTTIPTSRTTASLVNWVEAADSHDLVASAIPATSWDRTGRR